MILIAFLPLVLYLLALILGALAIPLPFASSEIPPLAAWMLFLSLGCHSLWAALGHLMDTERVALSIGWRTSPFQIEVGWANCGLGIAAVTAPFLGKGAATVVTLMAACFLWGAAKQHTEDMIKEGNFSINNAGPIYFWDLLTPLTLIIALLIS